MMLETAGLTKAFGGVRATDGVALAVAPGEVRALIGPNGAGKTTLFNLLTGHLRPDAGSIRLEGREIAGRPPDAIWRLGLSRTFQIPAVFAHLPVLDNVLVPILSATRRTLDLLGTPPRAARVRAEALLARVELAGEAGKRAGALAYGDLKKLELAIALASDPRLLLLDEPTAGMAPAERQALMGLVGSIAGERGLTILFTEHDMDVVFAVARRISVLHQGRLIADGTPAEIRENAEVRALYLGTA
jgi:branched-chain amino acid transport system ATP-binding protein